MGPERKNVITHEKSTDYDDDDDDSDWDSATAKLWRACLHCCQFIQRAHISKVIYWTWILRTLQKLSRCLANMQLYYIKPLLVGRTHFSTQFNVSANWLCNKKHDWCSVASSSSSTLRANENSLLCFWFFCVFLFFAE